MLIRDKARPAIVRPSCARRHVNAWGVGVTILVSGDDTGGRYAIIEYVAPPSGLGPPLHLHRAMEETFHVVDGRVQFQIGDEHLTATTGAVLHVPAGTPHAFWNDGQAPARMLVTFSPGGFEDYLVEMSRLASEHPQMTNDVRPLIARVGGKYDQVVLGPSPAAIRA